MLTIGKLAAQTELSTNALRFYEREGLLQPRSKSPAGYRLYGDDAEARVSFIKHAPGSRAVRECCRASCGPLGRA